MNILTSLLESYRNRLEDEIPPVVVDPRRPQAIFMMQENYFGSVMFGALVPKGRD